MPACSDELCFCVPAVMCHIQRTKVLSKIIFTVCQLALMNCVLCPISNLRFWRTMAFVKNHFCLVRVVAFYYNDVEDKLSLVIFSICLQLTQ